MLSEFADDELKKLRLLIERRIARLKVSRELSEADPKMRSLRQFRKDILNEEIEDD